MEKYFNLKENLFLADFSQILEVFNKHNYTFYREVRMTAAHDALEPIVSNTRENCLLLENRINYRLLWLEKFSEFQFLYYLGFFANQEANNQYVVNLISNIVDKLIEQNKTDILDELSTIEKAIIPSKRFNLSNDGSSLDFSDIKIPTMIGVVKETSIDAEAVDKFTNNDFISFNVLKFNLALSSLFIDKEGQIDGLTVKTLRPVLYNSATKEQIYNIAEKYGINIPEKLTAEFIPGYIKAVAQGRKIDISEKEAEIDTMTTAQLKAYARELEISVSSEPTKQDAIEYILFSHANSKDKYKFVSDKDDYDMPIPVFFTEVTKKQTIVTEVIKKVSQVKDVKVQKKVIVQKKSEFTKKIIKNIFWAILFLGLGLILYLIITKNISAKALNIVLDTLFKI